MLWKRALTVISGLVFATALNAQSWNEPRVRDLVQRATDRRVRQLTDSGLTGYQATAHGYVTFLAQLGFGFRELPRVVKADELALEVYWRAPNQSKQRIVGRRDTTLLPTDIQYHQDHLGIVQNNFPAIIRIGDGDEVRDVPHPLSAAGLDQYEFALTDSLRITTPGRVIDVYEVKIRPRNDNEARFVGAVYLDRENAQVVRMAFGFTRPAYLDKQLEDVFVVLENGIVAGRYWLPRKQEIEIRRTTTWLDYPVRGIIRGRWDISDYELTEAPATQFFGPEIIQAPPQVLQHHVWPPGRLTDSIPEESKLPTPDEIRRTMDDVRRLARARATQHGPVSLTASGVSDFARYDRTSGVALGAGAIIRPGRGWFAEFRPRYAFGSRDVLGEASLGWESARGTVYRYFAAYDLRDVGDIAERSSLVNSFAAQEFGNDLTDYYAARVQGFSWSRAFGRVRETMSVLIGQESPRRVIATPFRGQARAAFDAASRRVVVGEISVDIPTTLWGGFQWNARTLLRMTSSRHPGVCDWALGACESAEVWRSVVLVEGRRPLGPASFGLSLFAGGAASGDSLGSQDLLFLGGPVSAAGQPFHSLVGDRAFSQTVDVRFPVPFLPISLGRFGRAPARASLAPHVTNVWIHAVDPGKRIFRGSGPAIAPDPFRATSTGFYRSVGVSLFTAFDLVKLDVSRPLSKGHWIFSVDVARAFWGIL